MTVLSSELPRLKLSKTGLLSLERAKIIVNIGRTLHGLPLKLSPAATNLLGAYNYACDVTEAKKQGDPKVAQKYFFPTIVVLQFLKFYTDENFDAGFYKQLKKE